MTVFVYKVSPELKLYLNCNWIPELCKIHEHRHSTADTICYNVLKFVIIDLAICHNWKRFWNRFSIWRFFMLTETLYSG